MVIHWRPSKALESMDGYKTPLMVPWKQWRLAKFDPVTIRLCRPKDTSVAWQERFEALSSRLKRSN
jgi:hypothetical protein